MLCFGFKDIQIAYSGEGYEKYEGRTVHGIANASGKTDLKTNTAGLRRYVLNYSGAAMKVF